MISLLIIIDWPTINWPNIDWTAISAIATLLMAIATFITLRHSRKQLEEMKRQWSEEHKPIIEAKLVRAPMNKHLGSTCIQLINYGKGNAENIRISFTESINNEHFKSLMEPRLRSIERERYNLLPNSNLLISYCLFEDNQKTEGIICNGKPITILDKSFIVDSLRQPIQMIVCYGSGCQYELNYVISYDSISSRESTIQEELNHIQYQISLLRESNKTRQ